jgi:chemotaxis protein methyltransferase CheR
MTQPLPDQLLSRLGDFVASQIGLHFPQERWPDLERGIRAAARQLEEPDAESCARRLLSRPLTNSEVEILASELTVGETYFFRDKRCFEILDERVLSELIGARHEAERPLRVWSAGCCTGEEPYSIAIFLDRAVPKARRWDITILGTDINPHFIRKADEGVFGEWSFRGAPPWLKESYFTETTAQRFRILPRIREMVTFACLNLAQDGYPSLFSNANTIDLIFCRNVLMYFAPNQVRKVIQNFHRALVDSGWLIVSPTDPPSELFVPLIPERSEGGRFYRKTEKQLASSTSFSPSGTPSTFRSEAETIEPAPIPVRSHQTAQESAQSVRSAARPTQTASIEEALYREALALFEQGLYAEAVQKLDPNRARYQAAGKTHALLARAYANLGSLSEARRWAERALATDKLNSALHYMRAVIVHEQGATEEALLSLKRAVYLEPDFVLAHFALANHALRERHFNKADKHFANALALLARYQPDAVLPDSDGLAAGRLKELIESTISLERRNDRRS